MFQSPYHSQVQFGRVDPSSQNQEKTQNDLNGINNATNTTLKDAQNFQTTQTSEVKPTVSSSNQLDVYA
ncbi:hypothetical protein [Sulfurimonas sp.]|uniref:hypothetical protein n=1 Tax=Sulfurimonas sp. TaxID=2022749 RepID=UPI003563266D